ncbi:wax ester/triacylglycerol synthase domain-containing protein [Streptomyces sp. NPDC001380]|uniref:wax ester/triacylglycerol synthase domain-containing protein n=1 Tax=Streptomyces sp. NPDC001380 TaxID=3364566 RepID=UPI0036776028
MPSAAPTALTALDSTFWSLESRESPMHLGALLRFGPGGPSADVLPVMLAERAARSPRLRQIVSVPRNPFQAPRWIADPHFHAPRHVRVHALPGGGAAVERLTASLMAAALPRGLPPWELHLLVGPGGPEQGFHLLAKLHHATVDGLRAVEVVTRLLDRLQRSSPAAPGRGAAPTPGSASGSASASVPAGRPAAPPQPPPLLRRLTDQALRSASVATDVAATALANAVRPGGHPLHGPADVTDRVLTLRSFPLADLQRIRRAHGGTLHDVVLALLAGALRRWYLGLGHDPERHSTRVLVPVSRRTRPGETLHGNQLSGYLVTLPLAEPDALVRLFRVRESMSACKDHGPSRGAGAIATLPEVLPAGVQRFTGPLLRPTAPLLFDALATDVPVPGLPFTLGGAPLAAVHALPPVAHGHLLALAASRYRDRVHLTVHGTVSGHRDPRLLGPALRAELAELLRT